MWQLIINGPGYFDTTYDLPDGVTTLGRADENDIVLSGDLVSRKHARIHVKGDDIHLEDLGSRNGSRLNGEPVHGTVVLKPSDAVNVGENSLGIRQPATVESATTEVVDLGAGGVKRFGQGIDIASAVILARDIRDSVVLRVLDNIAPFEQVQSAPLSADITPPHGAPFPEPGDQRPIAYDSLVLLYKVAEKLSTASSMQVFLEDTADRVMERVNATTAVVLLRHSSGVMVPAAVRHRGKLAQGEVPVSDAVVEAALAKGAAIAVGDVRDDQRFAERESVVMYGIDQVLCVPIGQKEPFAGVLYLNKSGKEQGELEPLLDLCTAVAQLVGIGVEKFAQKDKAPGDERLRKALERFHAPDIVDRRISELNKGGPGKLTMMEEKNATLLFADISGFTALAQKLSPERVVEILNEFYQRMT
ncbi:MAG: FHA domain-containing protein, partial [Myxococcaceae bacterium]